MRKNLLRTVGPIALAIAFSGVAYADSIDMSGTLSGSYAYFLAGDGTDLYGVNGALAFPLAPVWTEKNGIEVYGGYHSVDSGDFNIWNLGGALYTGGSAGQIAASYMYHSADGGYFHTYGLGGEWFTTPSVSLAVRGGGVSGDYGLSGGYVGGQAKWYVVPNVSLSAGIDYWSAGTNLTSETFKVEWLVSESTPVALYGGYQHLEAYGSEDVVFVGIKLFTNSSGAMTLVDRERTGTLGYITQSPFYLEQY